MKWRNHKLLTFGAVYSLTGGLIVALSTMLGSVLPDVMELGGIIRHRTITHYLWLWLSACLAFWGFYRHSSESYLLFFSFFASAGAILHICQDALSIGGVPLVTPYGQCSGLKVYRTGTLSEEITVWGLEAIFIFLAWWRGFIQVEYFQGQLKELSSFVGGLAHAWR